MVTDLMPAQVRDSSHRKSGASPAVGLQVSSAICGETAAKRAVDFSCSDRLCPGLENGSNGITKQNAGSFLPSTFGGSTDSICARTQKVNTWPGDPMAILASFPDFDFAQAHARA